ncbi:MAG: protein YgfX [Pseudomonadota bacterium]
MGSVLLVLLVVDLPLPLRFPLLVAFCVAAYALHRQLAADTAPRRLEWAADGGWTVDGRQARLAGSTRVYPGLVLLRFRERGVRACWVLRGEIPADDFRRLKARLRLGSPDRGSPVGSS